MIPQAPPTGPVLRDIHLPPPPPWWPPAPGWWVLAGVVLLATFGAMWWLARRRAVERRRRQWLAELARLRAAQVADGDTGRFAAGVQQLLRRVARAQAADATRARGTAWHAILARVRVDAGVIDALAALDGAIYPAHAALDTDALATAARAWLRAAANKRGWRAAPERTHA